MVSDGMINWQTFGMTIIIGFGRHKQRNMISSVPMKDTVFIAVKDCEKVCNQLRIKYLISSNNIHDNDTYHTSTIHIRWFTHCKKWAEGAVIYGVKWTRSKRLWRSFLNFKLKKKTWKIKLRRWWSVSLFCVLVSCYRILLYTTGFLWN